LQEACHIREPHSGSNALSSNVSKRDENLGTALREGREVA
jgi:hypothetical protein